MSRLLTRSRRRAVRRRVYFIHWLRLSLIGLLLPAGLVTGLLLFAGGAGLLGPALAAEEAVAAEHAPAGEEDPEWCLTLVNGEHPLPPDHRVELTLLGTGQYVDERICPALEEMFHAARSEGYYPVVLEGYRTGQQQKRAREERVDALRAGGMTTAEALAAAGRMEAEAGYGEHQLGLAVDIGGDGVNSAHRDVQRWLRENSWRYGFILRYPPDKTGLTGMDYAPEHFRYVGKEAAAVLYGQGLCLEEYIQ